MKSSRSFLFLFSLFFFFNITNAQPENLRGLDALVEQTMKDWKVPGVAIAIVQGDKVLLAKGYGYRNVEKKLPVTENTLFAIGSTTKAMTAVTVCQLVDDGLIDLDKPLIGYLPSFRMHDEYVTMHMTARDLMCHRSGLPRHDLVWYGSDLTREELFKTLQYLEPTKGFREVFQYQNLMFMTAGYLVEQMRGKSWEEVMRERIFKPLGMNRSNFSVIDFQKDDDFSLPYAKVKDEVIEIPFRNIDAVGPAGSVNSSVKEMSNWLIMQIKGGKFMGKEIISESMLKQTHRPYIIAGGQPDKESFYALYGLGWGITTYRGHHLIAHGGGIDGFITQVAFLPQDSIGLVVLTNQSGAPLASILANSIMDRMLELDLIDWNGRLQEQFKKAEEAQKKNEEEADRNRQTGTKPSHSLGGYAGKYQHPAYGTVTIEEKNGQLHLSYHTFNWPLEHYHFDQFQANDPITGKTRFAFHTNGKGKVDRISSQLEQALDHDIFFERVPEEKEVALEQLKAYIGEYEIAGATIKVWLQKETLMLTVPGQPDYELMAVGAHEFVFKTLKGYSAIFESDQKNGKVTELVLNQPNGIFRAAKKE